MILEDYLNVYTTALKNKSFTLIYIDAFAGAGQIERRVDDGDAIEFLHGSTERALRVQNQPFDELIFIEKDAIRCEELERLRDRYPDRDIKIEQGDANRILSGLGRNWNACRGVLFLDPFATEVEWSTPERIAALEALDTWILFPVSAIARMLPASREPDDISPKWASRLTIVFGDQSWRELYHENPQGHLFRKPGLMRERGIDGLLSIYKGNLKRVFGNRFLEQSRPLVNSAGSRLFEFMFCVGHPKGISLAKRIAGHILHRI